ncbi:hypothetical protein MW887_003044 [Aspergillus wentii]|nr:hypothetical protein MW887_003044 [Aspergillus wentii]
MKLSIIFAALVSVVAAGELTPKACIAKDGVCWTGAGGSKGACCQGLKCTEVITDLKHCK